MADSNLVFMDGREKGQFPLSIATSLALEGAFAIMLEKENPKVPPIQSVDEVWINVRTLFRNIHGCFKKEDEVRLTPPDYALVMREEMTIIRGIVAQRTAHRVSVHFYACHYNRLTAIYKHAIFKEVKTDRQKHYAAMENMALEELQRTLKSMGEEYYVFDTTLEGHGKRAMMMTNYPLDLLSNRRFDDIQLLESHSGVVKTKAQWHTKLHNGKELVRIPFDIMTIQMFGDSGNLFTPYPMEFRRALLDIAEKNKWTPTTTKERIKLTVKLARMPQLEAAVMKLYAVV